MSNIDLAISEFGQSMDMAGLKLDGDNLLSLQFASSGTLTLERFDDSLFVFLARPFDRFRGGFLEQALELCHPRHGHAFQPRAGLTTDEQLLFALRLDSRDVHLASLSQAVRFLLTLFDRLEKR